MHLLEQFSSLDKNEKVISAIQGWRGRAALFVLCVLLFSVESADLFKAVLLLGWTEVPVNMVKGLGDVEAALEAEQAENTCRKDLQPDELIERVKVLAELGKEEAAERKRGGG